MLKRTLATFAFLGLLAIPAHATVVMTTVSGLHDSNPGTVQTAIQNLNLPGEPSNLVILGQWDGTSGKFTSGYTSFTSNVTITPSHGNTRATFSYTPSAGDPVLYFIAAQGGSGSSHLHNVYYNKDWHTGDVIAFPDSYSYIYSTSNTSGRHKWCDKLTGFSHMYFFGKLAAVPEPSALVTGISLLFLGFVTIRARRKMRENQG